MVNKQIMNELPSSFLTQPFESLDMDAESFRKLGYEVIDSMVAYYSTIRERSVISAGSSKEIEAAFNEELPVTGQEPAAIFQ